MHNFTGDTFNDVYPAAVSRLMHFGDDANPRGTTTRELYPVTFSVANPEHHLLTSYGRPINVAFALAEVLWILQGRKDVSMLKFYNSNIAQFSDNGHTFNAPYGFRLREAFGFDQIEDVIRTLADDPDSRQAVMNIWKPDRDRGWNTDESGLTVKNVTKDRACNLLSHLMIREGRLHWLQIQRSNDIIWGTPYNWMQFSHLQKWIARVLGVGVGSFEHVVHSLHYYRGEGAYYDGDAEVSGIVDFDLYDHVGGHSPWGDASTNLLDRIGSAEELIRSGSLEHSVPRDIPPYWNSVLNILKAHKFYRMKTPTADKHAAEILVHQVDPVYGFAQIRFYLSKRWGQKGGPTKLFDDIGDHVPYAIRKWLLDGVEEAQS